MTKRLKRDPLAYIKKASAEEVEPNLESKVIPKLEPKLEPKVIPKVEPNLEPNQLKERINSSDEVNQMQRRTYYLRRADILMVDEMAKAARVSKNAIISAAVRLLYDGLK